MPGNCCAFRQRASTYEDAAIVALTGSCRRDVETDNLVRGFDVQAAAETQIGTDLTVVFSDGHNC